MKRLLLNHLQMLALFAITAFVSLGTVNAGPIPTNITDYFPVGRTFSGVKIPSYSDKDVLQSVMEADSITRKPNGTFDITNLKVKIYDKGKVRTTITMKEAIYHIKDQKLESKDTDEKPKVIDMDFIMTGDMMTVYTTTQVTKMTGNVRVVIPDAKKITKGFDLSGKK